MMKERQTVEINFSGMEAHILEPVVNTEASEFMAMNQAAIKKQACKMGVHRDMVDDLFSDVYISIREAELRGEGYNIDKSNEDDVITVEEFVYGRIKRYSMNVKYRNDASERHVSKDYSKSVEIYSASSTDASDLDKLDGFQKAYAMAATYDAIDDVDAEISLRSNIELCLAFNESIGFNILAFFREMDMFSNINFNTGIFDRLKDTMSRNAEFRDAFKEIMMIAISRKPVFETVVETM